MLDDLLGLLTEDINRMLFALLVGSIIGIEREYRSKSAGLRTMILVCLGSCLFTILSIKIGGEPTPERIAANIVTGIGFLGAGVIFKDDNKVTGITTATTIWMVAALGMAVGAGHFQTAAVSTVIVMVVLVILVYLQKQIETLNQLRNYRIVYNYKKAGFEKYERLFQKFGLKAVRGAQSKSHDKITGYWIVQGAKSNHNRLISALLDDEDIRELDF